MALITSNLNKTNFWAEQISANNFILKDNENNYPTSYNPIKFLSNNRLNTTIPTKSRKDSFVNNYIISNEQSIKSSNLIVENQPNIEVFNYHLEGNNFPEFLPRPNFFNKAKSVEKGKKLSEQLIKNNEIIQNQTNPVNLLKNNNSIRPNTADDVKFLSNADNKLNKKNFNIHKQNNNYIHKLNEKSKDDNKNTTPIKRAGTSNLLFRRTTKNLSKKENINNNEKNKNNNLTLFEKYQNFLDEKRKALDKKFEELREVIKTTKNINGNFEEKSHFPRKYEKYKASKTFTTAFFHKKDDMVEENKNKTLDKEKENDQKNESTIHSQPKKKIMLENYEIGPTIGKGSYAIVKLGIDKLTKEKVAIKTYEKFKLFDPQKKKNVQREISILQKISHPNIIHLIKIIDSPRTINLVMEFISTISMHGYIKTFENRRIPEIEVKCIFKQIVEGINYLHNNHFVHRDIKLENILIDNTNKKIKIIDFGFSVFSQSDKKLCMFCGTPSYMAPEIVSKQDYNGKYVDIWALGILLFTMLCGKFPFKANDDKELYKKINSGNFEIPGFVSFLPQKLIKNILKLRPSDRPSCLEILEDNWFKEKS